MDEHCNSIVGISDCKSSATVENQLPVPLHCFPKNEEKALENYYTIWLKRRDSVHKKLSQKVKRIGGDLLMNTGDRLNEIKEQKAALEYTRIPQKFDKYRGNPAHWQFPPGLHEKCTNRPDKTRYFYQKTKVQKNEIPVIERVGVPEEIQNEKLILPRTRNVHKMWQNSSYRKQRMKELSDLLKKIIPHEPQLESLVVIGNKILPPEDQSKTFEEPIPSTNKVYSSKELQMPSVYDLSLNICLKINNVFFYENSQTLATVKKFHILFQYDVQNSPLQTKYITFENVGRVTLRIFWKEMQRFRLFQDIVRPTHSEFFCFDKNMLLLVPGQIINFPIWFQTNKICTVVETWEITTVPVFWKEPIRVFFVLQAQTHIEHFTKKIKEIKQAIERKVKKRIIKEVLEDALIKTKYRSDGEAIIDYFYYEPQIFEASNFKNSELGREPKYLYDKEIVEELKEFYVKVRRVNQPETWDLNVENLKIMARVQDLIEYAEERTQEFSKYRMKNSPTTNDVHVSDDTQIASSSPVVGIKKTKKGIKHKQISSELNKAISSSKHTFEKKETNYGRLMKLLFKLDSPCVKRNEERIKYFQVYSILCAYFSKMSDELYDIKAFESEEDYPYVNPYGYERLLFEIFDDQMEADHCMRTFHEDCKARPKSELLKNVPSEDIIKIHKVYFRYGVTTDVKLTSSKTNKGKKGGGKKSPRKVKSAVIEENVVTSDFDPFSSTTLPSVASNSVIKKHTQEIIETEKERIEENSPKDKIQDHNIYVTIYHFLENAIDAMVETLESAKEFKVSLQDLEALKGCFELIKKEESVLKLDYSINPFTDPSDRNYFDRLLSAHLNDITGNYLICGKTEHYLLKMEKKESYKNIPLTPTASVFTLPIREDSEISFKENGCQTSLTFESEESERQIISSSVDRSSEGSVYCLCPSEFNVGGKEDEKDNFYYSDDEEFGESKIDLKEEQSEASIVSEKSSVASIHQSPKASGDLEGRLSDEKCPIHDSYSCGDISENLQCE